MVSHLVKFLLLKHKDLNLNSQHSLGKPRAVASNYHPNPTEADNGPEACWPGKQPSWSDELHD